mmetsp:Transcript_15377/g.50500  ORF Transcript_15377/g.50500 Transcript_15377/m.50500 type:complete len:294 (+) Transcript_15377:21-902(+)
MEEPGPSTGSGSETQCFARKVGFNTFAFRLKWRGDEKAVDVDVTDGTKAWRARGARAPEAHYDPRDWWALARRCLAPEGENTGNLDRSNLVTDGEAALQWRFEHNVGRIRLDHAHTEASELLFELLQERVTAEREAAATVNAQAKQIERLEQELTRSNARVDEMTNAHAALKKELYSVFAQVLNEKKTHIRSLVGQLEEKDEKLAQARQSGFEEEAGSGAESGGEDAGEDDEEREGGTGRGTQLQTDVSQQTQPSQVAGKRPLEASLAASQAEPPPSAPPKKKHVSLADALGF